MIYEIFSSKALHMNSKICIEISVEVQETAQPVLRIVSQDVLCFERRCFYSFQWSLQLQRLYRRLK